ncbi:DUF3231 family protein [Paenibacillus sp. WC2504]|uniref:DUF3231 family protein n=1 Tax=Paenibacillus sp. WC2504 TaxID=3461403 RepID=UPI0040464E38
MGILSGNQKVEPLHYGEIYDLWAFSAAAKGCLSANRAYQYHAGDRDLKKIIDDIINQAELEISECDTILINNGIVPSPALPERPETKLEDIPVGVKFSDQEISAMVGADTSLSLVACSQNMGKATIVNSSFCHLPGCIEQSEGKGNRLMIRSSDFYPNL